MTKFLVGVAIGYFICSVGGVHNAITYVENIGANTQSHVETMHPKYHGDSK